MARKRTINIPFMGFGIIPNAIYLATSSDQVKGFCTDTDINPKDAWPLAPACARTTHSFADKNCQDYLVAVDKSQLFKMKPNEARAVLVHEAMHVVQMLYEEIGEDKPGAEQQAYLIQAITLFLFDQVKIGRRK